MPEKNCHQDFCILPSSTYSRSWSAFQIAFCTSKTCPISIGLTWTPIGQKWSDESNIKNSQISMKTYDPVLSLVQPVFLNWTILKILKTFPSLVLFLPLVSFGSSMISSQMANWNAKATNKRMSKYFMFVARHINKTRCYAMLQ